MALKPTQTALITDRLPLDVHAIVFGYLNLQDSISLLRVRVVSALYPPRALCLLQTSSALYFTRYLWAIVLDQAGKLLPLPCPPDQDFSESSMDFVELRKLASTAYRLEQNLSQERPQYKSIVQVQTSNQQIPVAVVPGHRIIVTLSLQERQLKCWNVATQSCLGIVEDVYLVMEHEAVCSGSPSMYRPHMENNRFVLGLISCDNHILDRFCILVSCTVSSHILHQLGPSHRCLSRLF